MEVWKYGDTLGERNSLPNKFDFLVERVSITTPGLFHQDGRNCSPRAETQSPLTRFRVKEV